MSQLAVKAHLLQVDALTRRPAPGSLIETEVEAELDVSRIDWSLRELLPEIDREARLNAAARRVDYSDYASDSDYREMLERVAGDYYLEMVEIAGAASKEYVVEGIYSGDGGLWGDCVRGINASEAEFQAAWTMACNAGCELDTSELTPSAWIDMLLGYMDGQRIESVQLKVPDETEAFAALAALHEEAVAAGVSGPAAAAAEKLLSDYRGLADRMRNDAIEYLDAGAGSTPAP